MTIEDLQPIIDRLDSIADHVHIAWSLIAIVILCLGIIFGGIFIKALLERFKK